jgi:hypothetical protein
MQVACDNKMKNSSRICLYFFSAESMAPVRFISWKNKKKQKTMPFAFEQAVYLEN